jgi:hypothetical protein
LALKAKVWWITEHHISARTHVFRENPSEYNPALDYGLFADFQLKIETKEEFEFCSLFAKKLIEESISSGLVSTDQEKEIYNDLHRELGSRTVFMDESKIRSDNPNMGEISYSIEDCLSFRVYS